VICVLPHNETHGRVTAYRSATEDNVENTLVRGTWMKTNAVPTDGDGDDGDHPRATKTTTNREYFRPLDPYEFRSALLGSSLKDGDWGFGYQGEPPTRAVPYTPNYPPAIFGSMGGKVYDFGNSDDGGVVENIPGFPTNGSPTNPQQPGFRSGELLLLSIGGRFIWPGVRVGFRRPIPDLPNNVSLVTLSVVPLVLEVSGDFTSPEESDYIVGKAGPNMARSDVVKMDKDRGRRTEEWRTSTTYFLRSRGDPILESIDQRVAALTRTPLPTHESYQVLRYRPSEKYSSHHDFFNPDLYKGDPGTMELIEGGRRNRLATVFMYLSDVESGGSTHFPRANYGPRPRSNECDESDFPPGMLVRPRKGKAIVFYNVRHDGQLDEYSLHGGCPVGEGVKWSANKWIWNGEIQFGEYGGVGKHLKEKRGRRK